MNESCHCITILVWNRVLQFSHKYKQDSEKVPTCLPYQPSVPVLWRTNYKIGDSLFKCHYLKVLIDLEGTKVGSLSSYINVKIEERWWGDCQFGAVPGALIDCLLMLDYGFIKHVFEGFVPHFELVYIIGTICMHSNWILLLACLFKWCITNRIQNFKIIQIQFAFC